MMELRKLGILSLLFVQSLVSAQDLPIRIVTFNIRYAASSLMENEKPWWDLFCFIWSDRCRQPHVINLLSETIFETTSGAASIIAMQEVLNNQLVDIKSGLGSGWSHIGVARDDGATSGEFSPILYRSDTLRVLYSETKWLSPTPDIVSYGWGAGSRRIVTIGVFEHIATGKRFIHANTHLDNVSSEARSKGILVAVSRIQSIQATWGPLGVSLSGDFNSAPGGDAYQALVNIGYMKDLYMLATTAQKYGPEATYTGFTDEASSRIDFVWLGPGTGTNYTVQQYEVLTNIVDGIYMSDHRAVVGDITLTA
jgi:endonuclease/exonuclease/phosphatase family metal-dependent hydrolase